MARSKASHSYSAQFACPFAFTCLSRHMKQMPHTRCHKDMALWLRSVFLLSPAVHFTYKHTYESTAIFKTQQLLCASAGLTRGVLALGDQNRA